MDPQTILTSSQPIVRKYLYCISLDISVLSDLPIDSIISIFQNTCVTVLVINDILILYRIIMKWYEIVYINVINHPSQFISVLVYVLGEPSYIISISIDSFCILIAISHGIWYFFFYFFFLYWTWYFSKRSRSSSIEGKGLGLGVGIWVLNWTKHFKCNRFNKECDEMNDKSCWWCYLEYAYFNKHMWTDEEKRHSVDLVRTGSCRSGN